MIIDGFSKLTLLDYPENVACIIWTRGCNFRCPFCQNSELIRMTKDEGNIKEEDVLSYLEKRKGILDGIVISGGEPTMQKGLYEFIKKVKTIGLKVKLDTNGFNPKILKKLIDDNLLDYVAVEIKNDLDHYDKICGLNKITLDNLLETIKILENSHILYEFRTTVMKNYHNEQRIENILSLIGKNANYYLQNFKDSEYVLDKTLESFSNDELMHIYNDLKLKYPNIGIRGI